mmetsp:Transcript_5089/g.13173  ORF Transcript_5089/g.13173 Transcript_5089/m.13173 type:complete len:282 (+) Transcript_5089:335-1180(+)
MVGNVGPPSMRIDVSRRSSLFEHACSCDAVFTWTIARPWTFQLADLFIVAPINTAERGVPLHLSGATRAQAVLRLVSHEAAHELLRLHAHLHTLRELRPARADGEEDCLGAVRPEGGAPVEQLVNEDAQRPVVRGRGEAGHAALDHLRRRVLRGAPEAGAVLVREQHRAPQLLHLQRLRHRGGRQVGSSRGRSDKAEAKVDQAQCAALGIHHDVLGLEIRVHDAARVQLPQRAQQKARPAQYVVLREGPASFLQHRHQVASARHRHDQAHVTGIAVAEGVE